MSAPYPEGTIERWAWEYITTTSLDHKRAPPPPPRAFAPAPGEAEPSRSAAPLRVERPGRPPELTVITRARKSPGPDAIRAPERRAELTHTFLHHELQAAELMCWAILAFPDTPEAFRLGLLGIARDEIRHLALYEAYLTSLGSRFGAFPVRDWFWQRVPLVPSPRSFVATFGMGLEGANLDHTARFAERFRAVGDHEGAALQERIGAEEVPHVRFALRWFPRLGDREQSPDFEAFREALPPPLSPILMRGAPLARAARLEAGFTPAFVDALDRWSPSPST